MYEISPFLLPKCSRLNAPSAAVCSAVKTAELQVLSKVSDVTCECLDS